MRQPVVIGVIGVIAVVACKGRGGGAADKDRPPIAGSSSTVAKPAAKAGSAAIAAGSGAPAAKLKAAAPTKAQRAAYDHHMRAGWAAQKTRAWAAAVPEFQAALVAIPHEARAVTELGWSAMNAGDFTTAREADDEAVAIAADRNVKASALYNLGVVQDRLGDKAGALHSFLASLQLRPNATVEQAVGELGAKPAAAAPFCAPGAAPCDCVSADLFGPPDPDSSVACQESTTPVPPALAGFHRYTTHDSWQSWDYLLDEHGQLVAKVAGESDRGRYSEQITLDRAEVKTLGSHRVLWVETTDSTDATHPEMIDETHDDDVDRVDVVTAVTLCVLGDASTPTRCPLRDVPRVAEYSEQHMLDNGSGDVETTPGAHGETDLDVALADDGTATVKLVAGTLAPSQAAVVGPHRLW